MPAIGDVVLFRLGAQTQRPLLVVSCDGHVVSGEVFVDWDMDRTEEWFVKGFALPPDPSRRQIEVRAIQEGPHIGQWQPKPPDYSSRPIVVESDPVVVAAEAARVNLPTVVPAQPAAKPPTPSLLPTAPLPKSHLVTPDPAAPAIINRPPLQKITVGRRPTPTKLSPR